MRVALLIATHLLAATCESVPLQLLRSAREAVASSCDLGLTRVIAVLHREHNHEAHCVCCHRGDGERIRRAGPVPGGAAGGEDLSVQRGFDLQTSRRRRERSLQSLAAMDAVDATPHAIKHRSRPSASSTRRRARARRRASRCRPRRPSPTRSRRRPRPRRHRRPRPRRARAAPRRRRRRRRPRASRTAPSSTPLRRSRPSSSARRPSRCCPSSGWSARAAR
jgi:hypothetical protein